MAAGYCEHSDDGKVFYLRILCVSPGLQRMGVGSKLIRHLKETLTDMDICSIYLTTHKESPARSFYERNGYRVSSEAIVMVHKW